MNGQNKIIQCEKIDAVTITDRISLTGNGAKHVSVNVNESITLNELIQKALNSVGKKTFFDYSGLGRGNSLPNNCQNFAKYILQAANCWTPVVEKFTFQDLSELAKEFPQYAKVIMNIITDAGQIVNNVRGAGLKKRKPRKKKIILD
jgi:hypothetical protein